MNSNGNGRNSSSGSSGSGNEPLGQSAENQAQEVRAEANGAEVAEEGGSGERTNPYEGDEQSTGLNLNLPAINASQIQRGSGRQQGMNTSSVMSGANRTPGFLSLDQPRTRVVPVQVEGADSENFSFSRSNQSRSSGSHPKRLKFDFEENLYK